MFYIYIILGLLAIHCTLYYLNIDVFHLATQTKNETENSTNDSNNVNTNSNTNSNVDNTDSVPNINIANDLSISIETSINELKNLNQYIDNELGQTSFC